MQSNSIRALVAYLFLGSLAASRGADAQVQATSRSTTITSSRTILAPPPFYTPDAAHSAATAMYIEGCSLGCSSGAGGTQIGCAVVQVPVNAPIVIHFSRPVDPASVSWFTFQLIDVNTGQVPLGVRFVDPLNPSHVVFQPDVAVDVVGQLVFGLHANTTYRIIIPGVAQGDTGPFITSTDVPALENQSRMECDIAPSLGVQSTGLRYCSADGSATHCPCANSVNPAGGCPNSVSVSGASLLGLGISSLSSDHLLLFANGMPNTLAIFLQGTSSANGGQGFVIGDGLFCLAGQGLRLAQKQVLASASLYPSVADLPISIRGGVSVPGTRTYQVWYHDPTAFCTNDRFNLTNALTVTWGP